MPDSIGQLSYLKYLNLSGNIEIEELPNTITKLQKLQTLNLEECRSLKALPNDFSKLTCLRLLNIKSCSNLMCMRRGMRIGPLRSLHKLSDFIVGDYERIPNWQQVFEPLKGLLFLEKLQGRLNIVIRCPNTKYVAREGTMVVDLYPLQEKLHLKDIELDFKHEKGYAKEDIVEETKLMKMLQPSSNTKYIKVRGYNGVKMGWNNFSSNLVELVMVGCEELKCLPCLGNLLHLKVLQLSNLKKLEYIGQDSPSENTVQPLLHLD